MHPIHCLNNISAKGTDLLTESYEVVEDASAATGILVRSAAMHDMEFPPELLAIARAGAGVNNIPLDRCAEEGIVVFNTPGANANAVKELVLCGLLLGSRGILDGANWCRDHAEDPDIAKAVEKAKKSYAGCEIMGRKLGVIGLGAIGAKVANAALDLGMEVYGYDPCLSVDAAWRIDGAVHHMTDLKALLAECDYLTIHVPALEATKGMIDGPALQAIKPGAVFLNFSRDTLVDNEAMGEALSSGRVASYITDFAVPEVMKMEHAIVLPHLGASTEEAEDNCAAMAVAQLMDFIENGNILNSVNYPACDMGACPDGKSRIAVLHANEPNMIGQITAALGDEGANIADLTNKARGAYAYSLIDLDGKAPEGIITRLSGIDGVKRARLVVG